MSGGPEKALAKVGPSMAVEDAVRAHRDSLIGFLRKRLHNADDAEDVAQETYVRFMQYGSVNDVRSAPALLYRIAVNIANDRIRAERARHALSHCSIDEVELDDEHPSAEREIAARQDLARLYEAIEQLPPKCRQVFVLSRVRHMTYPEIARHCGISVKMVEKHISHALAVCLKKHDS